MIHEAHLVNADDQPALALPAARCAVSIREATLDDFEFIDGLMKMHSHMVGFSPRKAIEKNIEDGHVLVAVGCEPSAVGGSGQAESREPIVESPIGYCIARDQYMKRDDVGIIYQLNVLPLKHRHLVGATLVKHVFDRAAYGCRLFCCWCAQDIQANWFWESIGFVPLAFRTGSRAKQRIHIFWQKRIREEENQRNTGAPGDSPVPLTPYWFPSQTSGGAVVEDRIVLPIPPGTHWRDAKPVLLPGMAAPEPDKPKMLPGGAPVKPRPQQNEVTKVSRAQKAAIARSRSKHLGGVPAGKAAVITAGGVRYVERADAPPPEDEVVEKRPKKPRKPRQKSDPKFVKAARELRDRYLEEVNAPGSRLLPAACGKYDVSRQLEASRSAVTDVNEVDLPRLDAA